jgi:hypothetical protein
MVLNHLLDLDRQCRSFLWNVSERLNNGQKGLATLGQVKNFKKCGDQKPQKKRGIFREA